MAVWQKRARFVVAVFGIAGAVVVYFAIGRRPPVAAQPTVNRIDPNASVESRSANVQRFTGDQRTFEIASDTQLSYGDGRTRMIKVTIRVKKQDGHIYFFFF